MSTADRPEYSTAELLRMAHTMLCEARKDQLASRKRDKWLVNNVTLDAIGARVALLTGETK